MSPQGRMCVPDMFYSSVNFRKFVTQELEFFNCRAANLKVSSRSGRYFCSSSFITAVLLRHNSHNIVPYLKCIVQRLFAHSELYNHPCNQLYKMLITHQRSITPLSSHPSSSSFRSCCCWCLVAQSCPTLCDPTGCSPPGSSTHGILQARVLEWADTSFSRGSSWPRDQVDSLPLSHEG